MERRGDTVDLGRNEKGKEGEKVGKGRKGWEKLTRLGFAVLQKGVCCTGTASISIYVQ